MSEAPNYSDTHLRTILGRTRTIALVGVSPNPVRPSNYVARYLSTRGYRVIPVNPGHVGKTMFGAPIVESLSAIPASEGPIHMVDIFRRAEHAGAVVDEALTVLLPRGLQTIWMQIGVIDTEAAKRAEEKGVDVVMDRCPKLEHQRLHGELRKAGFNTGRISARLPR
ncbi:CoA-binding protein [Oceanibium sediminis]|uniref:CoA-binding protein n=1 Tax=Oceanibium sediminis TaxID=2026339 RepID=UPI000DD43CD4|nr:CoA-binding protein [Oceanibium sediminis]